MFCTQCGTEVPQHARFCSKCGQEMTPATLAASPPVQLKKTDHDMNLHITILGWLLIGCGILTGLLGMAVMFGGVIFRRADTRAGLTSQYAARYRLDHLCGRPRDSHD